MLVRQVAAATLALATREAPASPPVTVTIAEGAVQVNNAPPVINVSNPMEAGAIQITNEAPKPAAEPTTPATVTRLEYDESGRIVGIAEVS